MKDLSTRQIPVEKVSEINTCFHEKRYPNVTKFLTQINTRNFLETI